MWSLRGADTDVGRSESGFKVVTCGVEPLVRRSLREKIAQEGVTQIRRQDTGHD